MSHDWYPDEDPEAGNIPTVTVSLEIHNHYEHETVLTIVKHKTVEEPWDVNDPIELADWAMQELFGFTGTGRTEGDSSYDIRITASNDPRLVGKTFEIG